MGFFSTWLQKLHETFIETQYWRLMLEGFGNTIVITLGALLIGVLIGTLIARHQILRRGHESAEAARVDL